MDPSGLHWLAWTETGTTCQRSHHARIGRIFAHPAAGPACEGDCEALQGLQRDAPGLEAEWATVQQTDTLAGSPKLAAARISALGACGLTAEALTALEEFAAGTVTDAAQGRGLVDALKRRRTSLEAVTDSEDALFGNLLGARCAMALRAMVSVRLLIV
jgi:hypothetical protein